MVRYITPMDTHILIVIGGIGLFLLGMTLMTDGLKGLAGSSLRRIIARFTKSPASGVATGALTTAVLQSSSATTVATVGFVSAGLLTFPMALGIIFGANIGTTITGWLVAIIGFKLDLGSVLLPFVLIGVLMKMFGHGRLSHAGMALAGFAVLFLGIATLQDGMAAFEGRLTPDNFPPDTLIGRFLLVLIGIVITLITQSSSAGVATALVALNAGTLTFPQAAAMVIGMDVGTTFTAALATLGGGLATRRTGLSHVIYNVLTGIMAFCLLSPYAAVIDPWLNGPTGDPQIALVAFHTSFNAIGVLAVLGFTDRFARLVTRLVPDARDSLTAHLDDRLLGDPDAAVDAAAATLNGLSAELQHTLRALLNTNTRRPATANTTAIDEALSTTRQFTESIRSDPGSSPATHRRHIALLHALDHLERLAHRCTQRNRIALLHHDPQLRALAGQLRSGLTPDTDAPGHLEKLETAMNDLRRSLRDERHTFREQTIERATTDTGNAATLLDSLDSIRWLHRTAYHVWRIAHHLHRAQLDNPPPEQVPEAAVDAANDVENNAGPPRQPQTADSTPPRDRATPDTNS